MKQPCSPTFDDVYAPHAWNLMVGVKKKQPYFQTMDEDGDDVDHGDAPSPLPEFPPNAFHDHQYFLFLVQMFYGHSLANRSWNQAGVHGRIGGEEEDGVRQDGSCGDGDGDGEDDGTRHDCPCGDHDVFDVRHDRSCGGGDDDLQVDRDGDRLLWSLHR